MNIGKYKIGVSILCSYLLTANAAYKEHQYRADLVPFQKTITVMYKHLDTWQDILEESGMSEDDGIEGLENSLKQVDALVDLLPDTDVGYKYLFFVMPLKGANKDHFMALVHTPQPDTAFTVGKGHWFIGLTRSVNSADYNSNPDFDLKDGFIDVNDTDVLAQNANTLPKNYYHKQQGSITATTLEFGSGLTDRLDLGVKGGFITFTNFTLYDFSEFENYANLGTIQQSVDDLVLSLKYKVADFNNNNTQFSLKPEYKYPMGDAFSMSSSGSSDVALTAILTHKIREFIYLNHNFGYTKIGDIGGAFNHPISQKSGLFHWNFDGTVVLNKYFALSAGYAFVESPFEGFKGAEYLTKPMTKTSFGLKTKIFNAMAEAALIRGDGVGATENAGTVSVYFVTE